MVLLTFLVVVLDYAMPRPEHRDGHTWGLSEDANTVEQPVPSPPVSPLTVAELPQPPTKFVPTYVPANFPMGKPPPPSPFPCRFLPCNLSRLVSAVFQQVLSTSLCVVHGVPDPAAGAPHLTPFAPVNGRASLPQISGGARACFRPQFPNLPVCRRHARNRTALPFPQGFSV